MSKLTLATDVATALGTTLAAALKKIDVDEAKKIVSEVTKKINSGFSSSDIKKVAKPKINNAPKRKKVKKLTKGQTNRVNQREKRGKEAKENKKVANKTASDKKIELAEGKATEKFESNFWTAALGATGIASLYTLLSDKGKDPKKMTNGEIKAVVKKEKIVSKDTMGEMGDPGGLAKPKAKSNKVPIPRKKPAPPKDYSMSAEQRNSPRKVAKDKIDKILKEEGNRQQGQIPKKTAKKEGRFSQGKKTIKTPFGNLVVDSTDEGMSKFSGFDNQKELEAEEEMNFQKGGMPKRKAFGKGGMYKTPKKTYGMRYGGVTRKLKGK
jgi:hypothetical protein